MRPELRLLILIIVFAICSCGTTQLNLKTPCSPERAENLFSRAENLLQSNSNSMPVPVITNTSYIENYTVMNHEGDGGFFIL